MPDLIIKPTNTSGNKVIIQDQAGGAVLTTADSGATLSNVTVTSGNLSNSALVYPAGHILNVLTNAVAGNSDNFTSGSSWVNTVAVLTVTAAEYAGGSRMYVIGEFGTAFDNHSAKCRLMRDLPGSDEILSFPDNSIGQAPSYPGQWGRAYVTLTGVSNITAGGADHVFRVQALWTAGTVYYNTSGTPATPRITAFVIK